VRQLAARSANNRSMRSIASSGPAHRATVGPALDEESMMTHSIRRTLLLATGLACAGALACSFSYSSESFSDSSKSSSGSSGGDDSKFRNDVAQYTEAFVEAGGKQDESFFSGLGDLARKRGISDWESEPSTWEAIGRGLGRTGVSEAQRTAYGAAWAGGDEEKQSAMARGFAAAR